MSKRRPAWILPFAVLSAFYLIFSLYTWLVDQDLDAIFVGLFIVLVLYLIFWSVARFVVHR